MLLLIHWELMPSQMEELVRQDLYLPTPFSFLLIFSVCIPFEYKVLFIIGA